MLFSLQILPIFSASSILITACQSKAVNETNSSSLSSETAASLSDKNKDKQLENVIPQPSDKSDSEVSSTNSTEKSASTNNSVVTPTVSRGGSIASAVSQSTNKATAQSIPAAAANDSSKTTAAKSSTSKPELLDWWKDAQYVFPRGASAVIQDYYTGKTFKIVRTMGTNHADCEAASKADTDIIKSIWGGFSWARRPVIVIINGRRLAASMSAMPHAGIDALPAYQTVDNRSDEYGTGENLDVIKGNGMDGHFDIHFLNSTRHKDNQIDPQHQAMIKIAAGL
jgi:hypothetical protein